MRTWIKICGVTDEVAILAAARAGADAVGFVFAESPRRVTVEQAIRLARVVPPSMSRVAVFRHPDPVAVDEVVERFAPDRVQAEPDDGVVRVVDGRVPLLPVFHDGDDLLDQVASFRAGRADAAPLLVEGAGRGGRGVRSDWNRVASLAARTPLVLAGGLDADNVVEAVRTVVPVGVDVSSGVEERKGIKDPARILRFVETVRRLDARNGGERREVMS
jgi:phosphoribosylanthranilate isomerase